MFSFYLSFFLSFLLFIFLSFLLYLSFYLSSFSTFFVFIFNLGQYFAVLVTSAYQHPYLDIIFTKNGMKFFLHHFFFNLNYFFSLVAPHDCFFSFFFFFLTFHSLLNFWISQCLTSKFFLNNNWIRTIDISKFFFS